MLTRKTMTAVLSMAEIPADDLSFSGGRAQISRPLLEQLEDAKNGKGAADPQPLAPSLKWSVQIPCCSHHTSYVS